MNTPGNVDICEICRTSFLDGDELFVCPKCTQDFHSDHFLQWYEKKMVCPVCSQKLTSIDVFSKSNYRVLGDAEPSQRIPEAISFETEFGEVISLKIVEGKLVYFQSRIGSFRKYLLVMRWYYVFSLIGYLLVRGILLTEQFGSFLNPIFITGILLIILFGQKGGRVFHPIYDNNRRKRNSVVVIGEELDTKLFTNNRYTISYSSITRVQSYFNFRNGNRHYPGLMIDGSRHLLFGDPYTYKNPKHHDLVLNFLETYLGQQAEKHYFTQDDNVSGTVGLSSRMYYNSYSAGEILQTIYLLLGIILFLFMFGLVFSVLYFEFIIIRELVNGLVTVVFSVFILRVGRFLFETN